MLSAAAPAADRQATEVVCNADTRVSDTAAVTDTIKLQASALTSTATGCTARCWIWLSAARAAAASASDGGGDWHRHPTAAAACAAAAAADWAAASADNRVMWRTYSPVIKANRSISSIAVRSTTREVAMGG